MGATLSEVASGLALPMAAGRYLLHPGCGGGATSRFDRIVTIRL
jgi:hypothetical protein